MKQWLKLTLIETFTLIITGHGTYSRYKGGQKIWRLLHQTDPQI